MGPFRELRADEIDCRLSTINEKGLSLLLYKDARCDQNILDETVGPMNWQRHHSRENANCIVSIWDPEKGQWIEKEDTGTESSAEKEKGLASDSFKRACFNWGIGRELYTAPFIWIPAGSYTPAEKNGKPVTYDKFCVSKIQYTAGVIRFLVICNKSRRGMPVVYTYGQPKLPAVQKPVRTEEPPKEPEIPRTEAEVDKVKQELISSRQVTQIKMICKAHEMPEEVICRQYRKKQLEQLTIDDWRDFFANGKRYLEQWDNRKAAQRPA